MNTNKKNTHRIKSVTPGSIAYELEIEPGDIVLSINDNEITDIFDYHYNCNSEELLLLIEKADGEQWELEIEKDFDEDLGIEFENGLMDDYRSCHNKCIFCFIDQMPPGMRDTLYFKDDDSRLSFLQGNYVTLTNMSEDDIDRIIRYRLDPINISVQTTNPDLRCMMLHNRFAGDALKKIDMLHEHDISMNGQIVLCKGVNDGDELKRSITDLMKYIPNMQSVSVVPVGLSKFREGLYPLESFTKEDACEVIDLIESFQKKCMEIYDCHFIHASDEWYLLAGRDLPEEERYDGYIQLENGVGMLRLLYEEFQDALQEERKFGVSHKKKHLTIATGRLAAVFMQGLIDDMNKVFPEVSVSVIPIRNDFFGEKITVSGLITGQDLINQVADIDIGDKLLIPSNMLKIDEQIFLDDITLEEAIERVGVRIVPTGSSGADLLKEMLYE